MSWSLVTKVLLNAAALRTDYAAVATLIGQIIAKFGRLDAVVLNAGIGIIGDVATGALADWQTQFNVSVFSTVATLQAAILHLRISPNGGRIIFVSSGMSTSPLPSGVAYAAAKAAVNSIARSLKVEEPSIIAVSVHPGIVDTEILHELINSPEKVHPYTHKFFSDSLNGVGRYACVPAEEPAAVFAWLALHAPQELSGQFIKYSDDAVKRAMGAETAA